MTGLLLLSPQCRLAWTTHSLHISPMVTHTLSPPHISPATLSGLRPLRSLRVLCVPAKNFQHRIRSGSTSCGALCSAHTVSHASMNGQHALSPSSRTCSAISPSPPASVDGGVSDPDGFTAGLPETPASGPGQHRHRAPESAGVRLRQSILAERETACLHLPVSPVSA